MCSIHIENNLTHFRGRTLFDAVYVEVLTVSGALESFKWHANDQELLLDFQIDDKRLRSLSDLDA